MYHVFPVRLLAGKRTVKQHKLPIKARWAETRDALETKADSPESCSGHKVMGTWIKVTEKWEQVCQGDLFSASEDTSRHSSQGI